MNGFLRFDVKNPLLKDVQALQIHPVRGFRVILNNDDIPTQH
jgi:hypothetical protein